LRRLTRRRRIAWKEPTLPDAPPFAIARIDHIVLRVRDVARMRGFYCDVLGCRVEKVQEAFGLTQLRAGRSLIDLLDIAAARGGGDTSAGGRNMDHLCLRIDPFDADAIAAHLASHGVTPGPVVSRYGAEGSGPSIYLDDPEGNMVELKGPPASA